jgi:type IV pilus assembly protein PilE
MRKMMRGMSLMELLIVVVIVGILAAIAYPNYRQYVERSKRNEAKAMLLQIATMQERFYLSNNTFTADMTQLGFANADNQPSDSGAYIVDVGVANADDFTAVATYQDGGGEAGKCLTFQIDGRGNKTSGPLADCWTRTQ